MEQNPQVVCLGGYYQLIRPSRTPADDHDAADGSRWNRRKNARRPHADLSSQRHGRRAAVAQVGGYDPEMMLAKTWTFG